MDIRYTEEKMREAGRAIESIMPKGLGFALVVFDFKNPGIGNYISNAQRPDMVKSLRETANRLENNEDIPPATGEA